MFNFDWEGREYLTGDQPIIVSYPDMKPTNPKDAIGSGKVPLHLVPDTAVIEMAMAFCEGGLKYGPYNWREKGVRASIYIAAARRHMAAWWNGEDTDPDSGIGHLGKAMACLAVIIDSMECDGLNDDRPPAVDLDAMLERNQNVVQALRELYE